MLLWLQKKFAPELRLFKLKLFLVSFLFHLILLFLGLFFNLNNTLKIEVKKGQYNVPIVLLPLQKKVSGSLNSIRGSLNNNFSGGYKSKIKLGDDNIKILKNENQGTKKKLHNVEKIESKPKIYVSEKKVSKKLNKQLVEKIKNENFAKEQNKIKQIEEKKYKEVKEENKILKKELENNDFDKIIKNEAINENVIVSQNSEVKDVVYIGREDLAQLEMEELVKKEISYHWNPPAGLSKDLTCSIKVKVDNNGKLQIQILKSSKSIAFDLSIKRDLSKAVFPKELWGREVILNYSGH